MTDIEWWFREGQKLWDLYFERDATGEVIVLVGYQDRGYRYHGEHKTIESAIKAARKVTGK